MFADVAPPVYILAGAPAGALLLALLVSVATICLCRPPRGALARADDWAPRARRAFRLTMAAHALSVAGLVCGVWAALAPWVQARLAGVVVAYDAGLFSAVAEESGGAKLFGLVVDIFSLGTVIALSPYLLMAGPALFVCVLLVFPAVILSGVAATRLRGLARDKTLPKATACCAPSLVAVQVLLWLSALVHAAAVPASLLFYDHALLNMLTSAPISIEQVVFEVPLTSGFFFLCGAALFLLVAAILASHAGRAAKGFPGIGRSVARCCCVERDGAGVAPVAPVAGSGAEKDAALDIRDAGGEGAGVAAAGGVVGIVAAGGAVGVAAVATPMRAPLRSFFSRAPPPLIVELGPPARRNVSAAKRGFNTRFG